MKKRVFTAALLLTLLMSVCPKGTYASDGLKPVVSFTTEDADKAMEAFDKFFYDKKMKLYNTTSNGKGRAAIWTQAIYWDMLMNAYKRTGDPKYLGMIEEFYQGGYEQYDKYDWRNTVEWFIYDDIMWWVISMARAYEITGDQKYLDHSVSGFDRVWNGGPEYPDNGSYDPKKGGMKWGWKNDEWRGKMSCINYPTVVAACLLYNITKEQEYLDKAIEIYDWSRNNLFDVETGLVADSKHGDGPPHRKPHVYNQATCIGSGVMLYRITGKQGYLDDAILTTEFTKNVMCDASGVLPYRNGIEQGIYTAIFAQYIIMLIEEGQEQYLDWMRYNIDLGWSNRDAKRNLTYKDFKRACPKGVIEVYDASAIPALMQVIPSVGKSN